MVVDMDCGDGSMGGKTVVSFFPPTPPEKTGFHRYIFLLYKQTETIDPETPLRGKFAVEAFVDKWGLQGPVKAIHFKTMDPKQ